MKGVDLQVSFILFTEPSFNDKNFFIYVESLLTLNVSNIRDSVKTAMVSSPEQICSIGFVHLNPFCYYTIFHEEIEPR